VALAPSQPQALDVRRISRDEWRKVCIETTEKFSDGSFKDELLFISADTNARRVCSDCHWLSLIGLKQFQTMSKVDGVVGVSWKTLLSMVCHDASGSELQWSNTMVEAHDSNKQQITQPFNPDLATGAGLHWTSS